MKMTSFAPDESSGGGGGGKLVSMKTLAKSGFRLDYECILFQTQL